MSVALELVARSSLVLLIGALALRLLRDQPAALRHSLLAGVLVLAAAQPLLNRVMPAWQLPSIGWTTPVAEPLPAGDVESTASFEVVAPPASQRSLAPVSLVSVRSALLWIWATGALASLGALLVGVAWLAWLGTRSVRAGQEWIAAGDSAQRALGIRRPVRILVTRHPSLIVTWGAIAPVILLPAGASEWSADRVRVVVTHEMAHIARRDWIVQVAAECARALYWFNPLFWFACARLRRESEHASDDIVLDLGLDRTAYASHLVTLARAFRGPGRTWLPAPSIAHPSTLERRVRAMLNPHVNRRPVSAPRRAALVAVLLAVALPIAAVSQPASTPSGTAVDPSGLPLPDAALRLVAVSGGGAVETRSDSTGSFQFAEVPEGEYLLSARYPGFSSQRQRVVIARGQSLSIQLQVGTLRETVTVKGGGGGGTAKTSARSAATAPASAPPSCGSTTVGGNLKPPKKLFDVRPRYLQAWEDAGLEGDILLQARIGTDGRIRSVEVISPVHPELEEEALAAVSQWQFSPTYLNCEAVEVRMFVTVSFKIDR